MLWKEHTCRHSESDRWPEYIFSHSTCRWKGQQPACMHVNHDTAWMHAFEYQSYTQHTVVHHDPESVWAIEWLIIHILWQKASRKVWANNVPSPDSDMYGQMIHSTDIVPSWQYQIHGNYQLLNACASPWRHSYIFLPYINKESYRRCYSFLRRVFQPESSEERPL